MAKLDTSISKKKGIRIPEDIRVEIGWDNDGNAIKGAFGFFGPFLNRTLLSDKVFGVDHSSLLTALAIRGAFEGKRAGDIVYLPVDHLEKLQQVARKPSDGFNPVIMVQVGAYFDAIFNLVSE